MKLIKTLLTIGLFCLATQAFSGGFVQSEDSLPRNFGPFKLGMSSKTFSQITGMQPEACPICIQGENFATLDHEQLRIFTGQDLGARGIDLFFYNDTLYHIAVAPETSDVSMVTDEYSERFGSRGRMVNQGNGMAQLKWEDPQTLLTLNFRPEENEVFSVNFYDGALKQQRETHEALMFENTANLGM